MVLSNLGEGEWKVGMKRETMKSLDPSAARIVAYLDGLSPSLRYGDLRQAKVNALRKPHKGDDELFKLRYN